MEKQLVALRQHLGEGGKVQITSGEVTLLPVRALGRIVGAAIALGLDLIFMTNGERFLRSPDHLEVLVSDFGLTKIALHVDTTQRERLSDGDDEECLHAARDRFAWLVRETRRTTRRPLYAAHTLTVTAKNIAGVPSIVSWALRNADAVRILSFQPTHPELPA